MQPSSLAGIGRKYRVSRRAEPRTTTVTLPPHWAWGIRPDSEDPRNWAVMSSKLQIGFPRRTRVGPWPSSCNSLYRVNWVLARSHVPPISRSYGESPSAATSLISQFLGLPLKVQETGYIFGSHCNAQMKRHAHV